MSHLTDNRLTKQQMINKTVEKLTDLANTVGNSQAKEGVLYPPVQIGLNDLLNPNRDGGRKEPPKPAQNSQENVAEKQRNEGDKMHADNPSAANPGLPEQHHHGKPTADGDSDKKQKAAPTKKRRQSAQVIAQKRPKHHLEEETYSPSTQNQQHQIMLEMAQMRRKMTQFMAAQPSQSHAPVKSTGETVSFNDPEYSNTHA